MIDSLLKSMGWRTPFGRTDWGEIRVDIATIAIAAVLITVAIKIM